MLYERPELKLLFDIADGITADEIKTVVKLAKALYEK